MTTINWTQSKSKIYEESHVTELTKFILENMRGMLPLFGEELVKLEEYGLCHNIPEGVLISTRNHLRSQKDLWTAHFQRKISTVNKITKDFNRLKHRSSIELSDVIDYFQCINLAPHHIFKILKKNNLLGNVPEKTMVHINFIVALIAENNNMASNLADGYEVKLENYLRTEGIVFTTEAELRGRGMTATPDILFEEPITMIIDGVTHEIHWIDAKCFFLSNVQFIMRKLVIQKEKYTKIFGKGAFIFSSGFDKSLNIPDVLLLATDAF